MPERAIRQWVKDGLIPATMAGNRAYISTEWIASKLKTDGKFEKGAI
jgi:hypothetical protein